MHEHVTRCELEYSWQDESGSQQLHRQLLNPPLSHLLGLVGVTVTHFLPPEPPSTFPGLQILDNQLNT